MNTRVLGGILLIIGTSIGGGMLALPVTTAASGFYGSTILLFACWLVMTLSALLIMEVNLCLPANSNLISMARQTLGKTGAVVTWVVYLMLFYALLSAYMSGGTDIISSLFDALNIHAPHWVGTLLFVLVFGYIVYRGIQPVDYVNRLLMTTKLGSLFVLMAILIPFVDHQKLQGGNPALLNSTVMVIITSFGFATIVPSLRSYYNSDAKKLRLTIIIGSFIPLICYTIWDMVILGTLPQTGPGGLLAMATSGHATTDLASSISMQLNRSSVTFFAHLFTSICVLTAFLGVSLALSDFLADGMKLEKVGKNRVIIALATFLPSLILVLFEPGIFIKALNYAGILCVVLLVLMPALMAWSGRYVKRLDARPQIMGGKPMLLLLLAVAVYLIGLGISQSF